MEEKLEILLIEDDPVACEEIAEQIYDSEDMLLIGVTNNSHKAVEHIRDGLPDAVILDLELHHGGGSGLDVLREVQALPLPKRPYILITTNNTSVMTYQIARALGADFIMSKHQNGYTTKGVLDFLRITSSVIKSTRRVSGDIKKNTTETPEQYNRRMTRQIMNELNHVGINPKSVGYTYLIDAIAIMIKEPVQNICTIIATKRKKSEASVERAMQNAINRAWKTSDTEDLLQYYTARVSSSRGNPTITEFICYYANKLRNEY